MRGGAKRPDARPLAHIRPFHRLTDWLCRFLYFLEIAEFLLVGGEWNAVFPQNCLQRMLHTPVLRGCADAQGYRLPATDCGSCHPASARTKIHLKTVELRFPPPAPASEIQDSIALSSSLCPQSHGNPADHEFLHHTRRIADKNMIGRFFTVAAMPESSRSRCVASRTCRCMQRNACSISATTGMRTLT